MAQPITINGATVPVASLYRKEVPTEGGPPLVELEFAVMIRGRGPNRHFVELTMREPLRVGIPTGSGEQILFGVITNHQQLNSGAGQDAFYRHDLNVLETPESAARRAAEQVAARAAELAANPPPAPPPAAPAASADRDEEDESPSLRGGPTPSLSVNSSASVWGAAIQQMRNPTASRANLQDEPLEYAEMAGVEAVLVNLRVEALIEQLRAAGLISRTAVDHSFQRLIRDRFLRDATPVVGEHAARRASRQLMGDGT